MFRKKQRLCKKKEIEAVFKGGISAYNQLFGLKAINNSLEYSRYVVIISKKVNKSAVERNRIKRVVKNVLKKYDTQIKKPIDCVIISLKPVNKASFEKIEKAIVFLLRETKLI